jgi:hypothetical protein
VKTIQLQEDQFMPLIEFLGKELLKLLDEATIDTLEKEVRRGFPKTTKRQYAVQQVDIKKVAFTPYVGMKTLLVSASALGEQHEDGRHWYNPMVLFTGVNYTPEKGPNSVQIRVGNKDYYFDKLSLSRNDTRVRCDCLDARFRFSWWNSQKKSWYGQPFKYKRKTTTRPPVNPLHVVGACKHIFKLCITLYNSGVVSR